MIKLGATFPQTEIGREPGPIRQFATAAEELGYDYLMVYDHVLGADLEVHADWRPRAGQPPVYTKDDLFHEPIVLLGYIAAITSRIGMATGIIILPQRQTVLLAKQAAEIDVLSNGRLRLGFGTGWNELEYQALGMNFHDRGARSEEQIELMRLLWTQETISFEGKWHKLVGVGINPLPNQRPIPIWLGGKADAVLRRVARIADGWYPPSSIGENELNDSIGHLRDYAVAEGRNPDDIGVEGILRMNDRPVEDCLQDFEKWRRAGATRVTLNTESPIMWKRLQGNSPTVKNHGLAIDRRIAVMAEFIRSVDLG